MGNSPLIMGVLNVTPDSFSDGGRYVTIASALRQAEALVREGADIIDVGGESTRPGAATVSVDEELERTIPVIEAIARALPMRLSIDTRKYEVAREALRTGASLINDISAGGDIRMAGLAATTGADVILMHMQGTPATMQEAPTYAEGVVTEVKRYLEARVRAFHEAGVPRERLWVDPGIGFGKTVAHNLALLSSLDQFQGVGGRVVIGTSRKSFLAKILGEAGPSMEDREAGTLTSNLWAYTKGASVFRVHDVGALRRAISTWEAIHAG